MTAAPPPASMWRLVERAATERSDAVLLTDDHGRSLTARQLRDEAERVAAALHASGVTTGQVLSWQLPTVLEAPVLMAACARLGVVQNPIIPLLREREVGLITTQVRPDLVVVPATWRGFDHAAMVCDLGLPLLELELDDAPTGPLRLPGGDVAALPATPDPADGECRWIYYSSGTTSDPKGVRHTDPSVLAGSNGVVDLLGLSDGDVYPIAWPIAHIGGVAMLGGVLRAGGTLALFDRFDPATTAIRMAAHRPTVLGSATPFFRAYVAAQRRHGAEPLYPHLRVCVGGGAPTPSEVDREVAEALGVTGVTGAWGLTELPVATSEVPDDPDVGTSVGRPATGVEVRVVDGELRLKGPQCFLGYVDASLDAAAFDDEGWFRTGDLGRVDADGRVHVDGRTKDVIIRNAENVSALEVEEVVLRHPAVADATVLGVPDEGTGERVAAVVVLHEGAALDLPDLAEHCAAEGLARYKRPERLDVVAQIPRNSMGKILKDQLRSALAPS